MKNLFLIVLLLFGSYVPASTDATKGCNYNDLTPIPPKVKLRNIKTSANYQKPPVLIFNRVVNIPAFNDEYSLSETVHLYLEPSAALKYINKDQQFEILSAFELPYSNEYSVQVIRTSSFELRRFFTNNFKSKRDEVTVGDFVNGVSMFISFCMAPNTSEAINQIGNPNVINLP